MLGDIGVGFADQRELHGALTHVAAAGQGGFEAVGWRGAFDGDLLAADPVVVDDIHEIELIRAGADFINIVGDGYAVGFGLAEFGLRNDLAADHALALLGQMRLRVVQAHALGFPLGKDHVPLAPAVVAPTALEAAVVTQHLLDALAEFFVGQTGGRIGRGDRPGRGADRTFVLPPIPALGSAGQEDHDGERGDAGEGRAPGDLPKAGLHLGGGQRLLRAGNFLRDPAHSPKDGHGGDENGKAGGVVKLVERVDPAVDHGDGEHEHADDVERVGGEQSDDDERNPVAPAQGIQFAEKQRGHDAGLE